MPTATVLRKRFGRLKASLASVQDEDKALIMPSYEKVTAEIDAEKKDLEAKYETDKKALDRKLWPKVAEVIEQDGAKEKYEPGTLEKEWKKLAAAKVATPSPEEEE